MKKKALPASGAFITAVITAVLCSSLLGGCFPGSSSDDDIITADVKPRYTYNDTSEPFTSYSFNLSGEKTNYIASVMSDGGKGMKIVLEDPDLKTEAFFVSPPEGYSVMFPELAVNSDRAVNVIHNDFGGAVLPDLIEVMFMKDGEGSEAENAAKYYSPDRKGQLREIVIYDKTGENGTIKSDHLDRIHLNHTEADKFIYEITVGDYMNEKGKLLTPAERVSIKTITFDPVQFRFVIDYEPIHESNPLYFGYAYLAAANTAAQYMTVELMPGFDRTDFIEVTSTDGNTDYYFSTGSRLKDLKQLRSYLNTIFSDSFSGKLIAAAPQCYTERNGRLYSKERTHPYNTSCGILTFTDMEISDTTMLFRSRQEKFDENGSFDGYTDGGNFVIRSTGTGRWHVIQYRFPYL